MHNQILFTSEFFEAPGVRIVVLKIEGPLSVGEEVILRFYPQVKELLDEVRGMGWSYRLRSVSGRARVELDLEKMDFTLRYYEPRPGECEEGTYEISAEVGKYPPALLEVESIDEFELSVSTEHAHSCVAVDPLKKVITYITDVLWYGWGEEREPKKLSEAREVYDAVTFFLERGYAPKNEYVARGYKQLLDLFERKHRFTLKIELTVDREELVPGWKDLKNELSRFFYERGLLMEIKEEGKPPFMFRKPIP